MSDSLIWVSVTGEDNVTSLRRNRRMMRQQAIRHATQLKRQECDARKVVYRFVHDFPDQKLVFHATHSVVSNADTDPKAPIKEDRPGRKGRDRISQSDAAAHDRLLRLQRIAQTLGHITENNYNNARIRYNFDILDLSMFASAYMGRAAVSSIRHNGILREAMLSSRGSSFLDQIPQLYGESELLRMVVDGVLARAHQVTSKTSRTSRTDVFVLYNKGIWQLQNALSCAGMMHKPEVLCAVQLMQLFEVSAPALMIRRSLNIRRLLTRSTQRIGRSTAKVLAA